MKSRGKGSHSNLSEDLSAAQRRENDRMNGAVMKWREGKRRVACCCFCSQMETVIWALTSSEVLKNVTLLRSLKTSSQTPSTPTLHFCCSIQTLLTSSFVAELYLLPILTTSQESRLTFAGVPQGHRRRGTHSTLSLSRPPLLTAWPCHLHSCHLPSCFQRAALPRRQKNQGEDERKSKKFPFQ